MDAERRDKWIQWALDKLIENWKPILAAVLGVGLGATAATVSAATWATPDCPECLECPTHEVIKAECVVRIDRCLSWMVDTP